MSQVIDAQNTQFINTKNAVNQEESHQSAIALLVRAAQALGQYEQEQIDEYFQGQTEEVSPLSLQELQRIIERDNELGNSIKAHDNEESAVDTNEGEETKSSSSSSGMQAVFDLQGWITELMKDATENNAKQAQIEVEQGNEMMEEMNEQYEKIEKEEKEAKKKENQHSFWGFIKGLGDLLKDITKLVSDLEKDLATLNVKGLSSDMRSDTKSIKNNAAIGDLVDLGKLCGQVAKLCLDAEKNMITGNTKGLKSDAKKDFKSIEENPSLNLAIQLLSYAAVAASLVGAAATGGALSFLVVAAITVVALSSQLNSGGKDVLESLGVSKDVADKIMKIPSFDDVAKGMTDVAAPLFKALGVNTKSDAFKEICDVATVVAVAAAVGLTGNVGLAAMAFGTTLSSLGQKMADDSGAKGMANTILTVSLTAAGAVIAGVGACGLAKGAGELGEQAQQVMSLANKVNYITQTAGGTLDVISGAKNIDLAIETKDIADIQSNINLLSSQISLSNTQVSNLSDQLGDLITQYDQMIDNFGAVSAPEQAVAEALV